MSPTKSISPGDIETRKSRPTPSEVTYAKEYRALPCLQCPNRDGCETGCYRFSRYLKSGR
jgi:hypothetical protein